MTNSTLGNLKIQALKRADHYASGDAELLELAGGLINDCFSELQMLSRESMFWKSLDNTVTLVADQSYVDLAETDILEITSVTQRDNDARLERVNRREYTQQFPDPTSFSGKANYAYDEEQNLNGSGQNIFRLYFIPTPADADTIYYDYIKNAQFSADGTSADAEFSPLPSTFDNLIYQMFKPKLYSIIDSSDASRIATAQVMADKALSSALGVLNSRSDHTRQMASQREKGPIVFNRVKATPAP